MPKRPDAPIDPRFEDRLRQAVAQAERTGEGLAVHVLEVDLDGEANANRGEVARRIAALVRASDAWTELADHRFAILQRAVEKAEGALILARRLVASATAPMGQRGERLGATVGLCFHISGAGPTELLAQAEVARRSACKSGRRIRCFHSPAVDASSPFARQKRLLQALENEDLFLEFQPQVDLRNGRISAFEALVRWHHPRKGVVGPDSFIPLAESSGLIFELGEWVLQDACRRCREWNTGHRSTTPVAVNVSPIQLLNEGFPAKVDRILKRSGLQPELLELELTETTSVQGSDEAIDTMLELKALGVRLALDDFGTGYNSLYCLHEFPIDKVKTPKEFLQKAEGIDLPLIESIALLGRGLGVEVVAEGVETEAQSRAVRDAGCHFAQGFFWGKPTAEVSLMSGQA